MILALLATAHAAIVVDTFVQTADPVDLLITLDRSGSMADDNAGMLDSLPRLVRSLDRHGLD